MKTSVEYHGKLLDVYIIPDRFCKYKLRGIGIMLRLYMGARLADIIRTHINELSVLHAHWTYDFADACIPFVKIKPVFCTVRDWCPYIITTMKDLRSKLYWYISKIVFKKVINCKDIHFIANSDYVASRLKSVGIEQVPYLPNAIT